ncbi:MAG: 2-amino-4-hydroxy-6-hydroxymethyldihydropteridine diphosphokinase [Bacteroidales bacterium]|nr:2-amino-4-hydroxy-6-hydroxymethyldihydropteridine diphosphokinase [Bacteroidales bacterium]
MKKTLVFVLLGTNLGKRKENLRYAIIEIEKLHISSLRISSIYKSEPWGFESENYFLNQCLSFYTELNPEELLICLKEIEVSIGRTKTSDSGYEDRILDIDILFFGSRIINLEQLVIPHPRIAERRFTLQAVADLASDLIHPVHRKSIADLLNICPDNSIVIKL